MKTIISILILLTSLTFSSCGQKTKSNQSNLIFKSSDTIDSNDFAIKDFKALPSEYAYKDRAYLIDKIIPATYYAYWECVYKVALTDNNRGRIIVCNGDSLKYSPFAKKINSNNGFFVECHPGICFSYIIGVRTDRTSDLIDSNEKLKKFIGHIDNIEEVILCAKISGYWYDTDTIVGGAYRERDNDYLLYLLDYSSTPVTYKSVKAILTKDGDFRLVEKTIYKQTDEYIME
jgi:hypothetical protein